MLYHTASIAEIFVASPVDFRAKKGLDESNADASIWDLIVFIHLDNMERSNFSFIPMTLPVFNRHEKLYEQNGFSNVPLSNGSRVSRLCRIGVQTAPRFFATPPSGLATWPQLSTIFPRHGGRAK